MMGREREMEDIPRVKGKRDNILVLEMDLTHEPIQCCFADSIRCHWIRALLHATDATDRRAHAHVLTRSVGSFLEQRQSSLEEQKGADGVDIEVLLQIRGFDACGGAEGLRQGDTGVGNDNVEVGDVVLVLELLDYSGWVVGRGAVELNDDKVA